MTRPLLLTALLIGGAGCATTDPRAALSGAARLAVDRGVPGEHALAADAARQEVADRTRQLLAEPLGVDAAVEIALLANPDLQAELALLHIAQADLAQATRLANPHLTFVELRPQGRERGSQRTTSLEIALLDWLVQPLRKRLSELELERVRLLAGGAIVETAAAARSALVAFQAAEQLERRLVVIEELDRAGAEFADALFAAGNLSGLERAKAAAAWAESRTALSEARTDVRRARERVNVALGLWGETTGWRAAELPELPTGDRDLDLGPAGSNLERLAIERRLDLQAARAAVDQIGRALALKKKTRFFPVGIDVGVESEKELDGLRITGPTLALALPIFDTGRASVARLEAERLRARWQLEALAIRARAEVREKRDDLIAARDRALFLREKLLPLRAEILDLTLRSHNMMLAGTPDVLLAKQAEVASERAYVAALADYWQSRIDLERATGGALPAPLGESAAAAPQGERGADREESRP